MIAIDTNVLVRYLVDDDPIQSAQAVRFMENELTAEEPGFVSLVVIVEVAWVLRRAYHASAETVADIIRRLLDSRQVQVQDSDVVERAVRLALEDFADALIHELGRAAACGRTVTFDRRFAKTPGVDLLSER